MRHPPQCLVALALVLLSTPGCASMVYKSTGLRSTPPQQVLVTSEPSGALVRLNGILVGVTPGKVPVRRTGPLQTLSVALDGYETYTAVLKRELSGATYGNLLFGAAALNPLNGPNGLSDRPWSRRQQVAYAFLLPAVGFGVDALSGAAFAVRSPVHVTLQPAHSGLVNGGHTYAISPDRRQKLGKRG